MTTGIRNSLILHYNVILSQNEMIWYTIRVKGLVNVNGNIIVAWHEARTTESSVRSIYF